MPRSLSNSKVEDFEPRKKNPLGLLDDSNLDKHLKSLKIGDKTSPLQLSESEFRIDADLYIGGKLTSHVLETENQYFDIKMATDASFGYVRFIPGNLQSSRDALKMYFGSVGDMYTFCDDSLYEYARGSFYWITHDGSGTNTSTALLEAGGKFSLFDGDDTGDKFVMDVGTAGATSLATTDDDGTAAHLTLDPDGDLVLQPATHTYSALPIGFTQDEPTFDATDTIITFSTKGNKAKLTLTNNCTDIHFKFPAVSGNFICVLLQDGTGGRTISNWKTQDSEGNAGAGNSGLVLWAGGTAPSNTETVDKADIASFYWDADNEIAYGTYTYKF